MGPDDQALAQFASEHDTSVEAIRSLLEQLADQIGVAQFYVFWTGRQGEAGAGGARRRTLLAFSNPDDALAFAQHNKLASTPSQLRLRCLSTLQVIEAVLRHPTIAAVLFVNDMVGNVPAIGQLPHGAWLVRTELLQRLQCRPAI